MTPEIRGLDTQIPSKDNKGINSLKMSTKALKAALGKGNLRIFNQNIF
jgi:hypothetical protein